MSAFGPKADLDEPRIVRVDPEAEFLNTKPRVIGLQMNRTSFAPETRRFVAHRFRSTVLKLPLHMRSRYGLSVTIVDSNALLQKRQRSVLRICRGTAL